MKRIFIIGLLIIIASFSYAQESKYEKSIEIGGGFGLSEYTNYTINASMINGYRVLPQLLIGVGIGFRYSDVIYYKSYQHVSMDGKYLIQAHLRLKYNFVKAHKISPYLAFDGGGSFDIGRNPNKNITGLFYEPQLGVDFKLTEKEAINLGVGINMQHYQYQYFSNNVIENNEFFIGALNFHCGIKF